MKKYSLSSIMRAAWKFFRKGVSSFSLREPYSKAMGDGLFELRVKFASDITRIFYFFVVNNKIVLTNGFVKKTMRTPKAELDLARKYKADYERSHCNG